MAGCQAVPVASVSFLSGLAGHTGPLPFLSLCEDLQLQLFAVLPHTLGEMHLLWDSQLDLCKAEISSLAGKKATFLLLGGGKAQAAAGLGRVLGCEEYRGTQNKESPVCLQVRLRNCKPKDSPRVTLGFLCLEMGSGKEMSPEGHDDAAPFQL